ncbi:MAG: Flp pilus assembly protein CpaB [Thermoanaerobaculia bacterium]
MSKGARIAIAVVIGLIAALFGVLYLNGQREKLIGSSEVVRVYVATEEIPANTLLESDMIAVREMPRSFVQPQAFLTTEIPDKSKLKGVTVVPIKENEQILRTKLYEGAPPPLSADLKARTGLVGVGIDMSDLPHSLHGLVKPGDHVDVLASFQFEKENNEDYTEIRPMLQNIEVMAVNERTMSNQKVWVPTKPGEEQRAETTAKTVVVAVTPEAAQQVILAQQLGKIWLVLRAQGDTGPKRYEVWNNDRFFQGPRRLFKASDQRLEMLNQMRRAAGR